MNVSASTFDVSCAILLVLAAFVVATLSPGQTYTGPNVTAADGDLCSCNTVVYSLMSACAACQQGQWIRYVDQLYFGCIPSN